MTKDLTGAKAAKFRTIQEIMQQPSMKAKLSSYIDEAVQCKSKISYEQDNIKALREQALDELGLKPAMFNQYVAMVYSNDYVQRKEKLEELVDLVDYVMEDQNLLPGPRADDE
jgi:hypothetical protein